MCIASEYIISLITISSRYILNVKKPYKVITVKMSGDAYDVITEKNTLRVFAQEEIVTEI